MWREHGLLGVIEAGVICVVALYAPLHKLLPVSTKHSVCHLRRQETLTVTVRIKLQRGSVTELRHWGQRLLQILHIHCNGLHFGLI